MFSRKARKTYVHKDFYFSLFSPSRPPFFFFLLVLSLSLSLSRCFSLIFQSLLYLFIFFHFLFFSFLFFFSFFAFFLKFFFYHKKEIDIYPTRSLLRARRRFVYHYLLCENFSSSFSYIFTIFFLISFFWNLSLCCEFFR